MSKEPVLSISPIVGFSMITDDLVKLLVYKKKNKIDNEAFVIENAYNSLFKLFQDLLEEKHSIQIRMVAEATKAKMLEMELKTVYNELYKKDPKFATEMITRSYLPTKKQLTEEVIVK